MAKKARGRGVIEAAGGLLWRRGSRGLELAVVHRPRYDDWSLPKGWLHKGETWQEAALREVAEETGMPVLPTAFAGCTCYVAEGIPKIVLFWHMVLVEDRRFRPNDEIDELSWLEFEDALERLSYENEKTLLRTTIETRKSDDLSDGEAVRDV